MKKTEPFIWVERFSTDRLNLMGTEEDRLVRWARARLEIAQADLDNKERGIQRRRLAPIFMSLPAMVRNHMTLQHQYWGGNAKGHVRCYLKEGKYKLVVGESDNELYLDTAVKHAWAPRFGPFKTRFPTRLLEVALIKHLDFKGTFTSLNRKDWKIEARYYEGESFIGPAPKSKTLVLKPTFEMTDGFLHDWLCSALLW